VIELIFQSLSTGLSIWESKEKTKYIDKMLTLKRQWYEEYNKPTSNRSDARLDHIEYELRILVETFASKVGTSHTENL
jgi:hypothetical protein